MGKSNCTLAAAFLAAALGVVAADEAAKPAEPGTIVVTDAAGKEQKVKSWSFTAGTRRLGWLAADKDEGAEGKGGKAKGKKPAGPEALVVRDELKIHFLAGVVTLVPVDRLRSVEFDSEKETMTVRAAADPKAEDDAVLTGTTAYKGINKLTIEAEVDKGDAGVAAVTYQGGLPRGIKGVRFPAPKVEAAKPGRPAVVVTLDRDVKKAHKVSDLQALYVLKSGREKLSPLLMFRKTLKVDLAKVKKIAASSEDSDDTVWRVVQKDGDDSTLTLLPSATLDGQAATLAGLVGRVPAGYKLFPVRRVHGIDFDTSDEPGEKEKEKDKDKEKDGR
jgi:hypothetical protein